MKTYKIQHRDTGLYSSGGLEPEWNASGKLWRSIGDARASVQESASHFALRAMFVKSPEIAKSFFVLLQDIARWDIIEYEMQPIKYHQVIPADEISDDLKAHLKNKGFEMS